MAKHCRKVGATVLLEWPRFCSYWQEARVSQFLKSMNFKYTDFDGCMHGLVSRRGGSEGLPVRKPWRIALINSIVNNHLNLLCDGSHPHMPCNGTDAIISPCYTHAMCRAIMKSVKDDQFRPYHASACIANVCISASFEAQTDSVVCVAASPLCLLDPLLDPR